MLGVDNNNLAWYSLFDLEIFCVDGGDLVQIDERYTKMLGMLVYNKDLDKYGRVSSLRLMEGYGGYYAYLQVFYDGFDSDFFLCFEDFDKAAVFFVIVDDLPVLYDYVGQQMGNIRFCMGEKYRDDMVIYMSDEEWKRHIKDQQDRETQKLHVDAVGLTSISADVVADDFHSRGLYLKWRRGIISKEEMLYGIVNHLALELKRVKDENSAYFFKYEFAEKTKELFGFNFDNKNGEE